VNYQRCAINGSTFRFHDDIVTAYRHRRGRVGGSVQSSPSTGLSSDGASHLLVLQQLDVQIAFARAGGAGDMAQHGGCKIESRESGFVQSSMASRSSHTNR
jgi:hypothetical protein